MNIRPAEVKARFDHAGYILAEYEDPDDVPADIERYYRLAYGAIAEGDWDDASYCVGKLETLLRNSNK